MEDVERQPREPKVAGDRKFDRLKVVCKVDRWQVVEVGRKERPFGLCDVTQKQPSALSRP